MRFYRNTKTTDDALSNQLVDDEFEKFKAIAKLNESQPGLQIADFSKTIFEIGLKKIIIKIYVSFL